MFFVLRELVSHLWFSTNQITGSSDISKRLKHLKRFIVASNGKEIWVIEGAK